MSESSPHIILGVVTRQRPGQLRRCVTSAMATCGVRLSVVVGFDDDISGYEQCPEWPWMNKVLLKPRHYYVRGKNAVYKSAHEIADQIDGPVYYVQSNDDSEWLLPNWGLFAIRGIESQFPDGLGVVEMFQPGHCAHYITKFEFVDTYLNGQLGDPAFTMYFSDTDMMNKCKQIDRYRAVASSGSSLEQYKKRVVSHNMMATGDHLAFEVQAAWWDIDSEIFYRRYPEEDSDEREDSTRPDIEEQDT